MDNIVTLEGAVLVACLMASYDVNFAIIHCYKLLNKALRELTNLSFLCIIQRICDKASMPKI